MLFTEKVLLSVLHHQHCLDAFFSLLSQHKELLHSNIFEYCNLLHHVKEIPHLNSKSKCNTSLNGHLRHKFLSAHTSDSSTNKCCCIIAIPPEDLDLTLTREIVWQLLTYIDFELKWILEYKEKDTQLICYLNLLHDLNNHLIQKTENLSKTKENMNSELKIFKGIVEHPVILKLFLGTSLTHACTLKVLRKAIKSVTKLILSIAQVISNSTCTSNFVGLNKFKQKTLSIIQECSSDINCNEFELLSVIGTFSSLLTCSEIVLLHENLLSLGNYLEQSEASFPLLTLLVKRYLEFDEFVVLSPHCINSLFLKYVAMSKKQKKIFKEVFLQLIVKHPSYALSVDEDSFWVLLQHRSDKDLDVLGVFIEYNYQLRLLTQQHLTETIDDSNTISFIYLASKCLNMCNTEDKKDKSFIQSISDGFWKSLTQTLEEEPGNEIKCLEDCQADKAANFLLKEKIISPKKLSKFWKLYRQNSASCVTPSFSKMGVLLELIQTWKNQRIELSKPTLPVLQILFQWMTSALSKDFDHWNLAAFIQKTLQNVDEINISDIFDIKPFFQKGLKISMMLGEAGKDILKILILLCEKSKGINLPSQDLHSLVIGHSSFFNIMLSNLQNSNSLKEKIVELLTVLAQLDASVCKEHHVSVFLASYNGTMACIDQKLLYLLKVYSDHGINMIKYSPFLWGKAAIAHYSIMNNEANFNLLKQAKLRDVASLILPEKIENTILHYPLKMTLLPSSEIIEDIDEKLASNIYDLRFFLPLLANLLSPGSFVNINCFVESRMLTLIFASLSSYDADIRALGYYCLSQFYHHLESLRSKEKEIWISLLDCVRNSISTENPKLPCIITLFLARICDNFTKPYTSLYIALYKFIMVKPDLDLTHVPEFYKLFNSIELEYKIHRLWLLNLLSDGIRTSLDFHICEKRYIFSTIQTHYWSSLSNIQEKVSILCVIASAVKIESSAKTLCQSGLLLWIHSIVEQCEMTSEISSIINQILEDISKIDAKNLSLNVLKKLKKPLLEMANSSSSQQSSIASLNTS